MTKKYALAVSVTSVLILLSGAASAAQDNGASGGTTGGTQTQLRDLARRIEAMQNELEALKTKDRDLQAKQDAAAATAASSYVTRGDLPNSFKIPGTDTSVRIGGYAKLDIVGDVKGNAGGGATSTTSIPLRGSIDEKRSGNWTLQARQSRLNVETLTPTGWGNLKTYVEGDFYGAGGNEVSSNSTLFRLRHAYGELGPVLAGQTWTTMYDPASAPETLDFSGPVGAPQSIRQGQLRYTAALGPGAVSLALENPEGDFFQSTHDTFLPANSLYPSNLVDKVPDVAARYTMAGSWGRASLMGVMRYLTVDNRNAAAINGFRGKESVFGGGLGTMARINTFDKDAVTVALVGGPGIGRYIFGLGGGANGAYVNAAGQLKTQFAWGGQLGYQHYWSDALRSTVAYGRNTVDNPGVAQAGAGAAALNDYVSTLHANLIWSPVPRANVGVEYIYADRKVNTASTAALSNKGNASRVQFGFQYSF